MSKLGIEYKTPRGFALVEFKDANGVECSLQTSSALHLHEADSEGNMPYDYHLWIGCDGPNPKVMKYGEGWVPYDLPEEVSCSTRMHLTRSHVEALIVSLQAWLDSDETNFGGSDE